MLSKVLADLTFNYIEEGDSILFTTNLPKLQEFFVNQSTNPGMDELKSKFNENLHIHDDGQAVENTNNNNNAFPSIPDIFQNTSFKKLPNDLFKIEATSDIDMNNNDFRNAIIAPAAAKTPQRSMEDKLAVTNEINFHGHIFSPRKEIFGKVSKISMSSRSPDIICIIRKDRGVVNRDFDLQKFVRNSYHIRKQGE